MQQTLLRALWRVSCHKCLVTHVSLVTHVMSQVLDAADIAKGPLARIWLKHHVPHGLHGCFSSTYYGPKIPQGAHIRSNIGNMNNVVSLHKGNTPANPLAA